MAQGRSVLVLVGLVGLAAAFALGDAGIYAGVPILIEALRLSDVEIRTVAFQKLTEYTGQHFGYRPQGSACDSGAVEFDQPATYTITGGPTGTISSDSAQIDFSTSDPSANEIERFRDRGPRHLLQLGQHEHLAQVRLELIQHRIQQPRTFERRELRFRASRIRIGQLRRGLGLRTTPDQLPHMRPHHAPRDPEQPGLDVRAPLELMQPALHDDEHFLNDVIDVHLTYAQAAGGAPYKIHVSLVDLLDAQLRRARRLGRACFPVWRSDQAYRTHKFGYECRDGARSIRKSARRPSCGP